VEDIEQQVVDEMNAGISPIRVEIPAKINYMTELLRVMAVATEGLNATTEVKCQSVLPISRLRKMISECSMLYPLKHYLVHFFIDGFIDIEKDVPNDLSENIWLMLESFLEDT